MTSGSFGDSANREVSWNVIEVHDYQGGVYSGDELDEHLREADRVFYSLEVDGETFYRWVAGPFESESDLEAAIEDDADFYSEAA